MDDVALESALNRFTFAAMSSEGSYSLAPLQVFQFFRPWYFVFEISSKHSDSSLEPSDTLILDL